MHMHTSNNRTPTLVLSTRLATTTLVVLQYPSKYAYIVIIYNG